MTHSKTSIEVLSEANVLLEQNEEVKSIRSLIDFMIEQRHKNDDVNPEIITFLIKYILPPVDEKLYEQHDASLLEVDRDKRMKRIRMFVTSIFSQSFVDLYLMSCELRVTPEIQKAFESITLYIILCIKQLTLESNKHLYEDIMLGWKSYLICQQIADVELCTFPLKQMLTRSKSPDCLYAGGLNTMLRMMHIMFQLNHRWGRFFQNISQQLIPNSLFGFVGEQDEHLTDHCFQYHPYLLEQEYRISQYRRFIAQNDSLIIIVSRNETLERISNGLLNADVKRHWIFRFKNEIAKGPGVSKEFYTIFSHEIQKYDLNLWIGDPQTCSDGNVYVNSQTGLFPSPCLELNENSRNILITTGKLMAKSIITNTLMDVKFSKALYKFILEGERDSQCLTLNDIRDVMPCLDEHVQKLITIMFKTYHVKNDQTLTLEEKSEAMSNIKYDGEPLEQLCIYFTIPGYPNIDMIEDGANVLLTTENVEHYLKCLVFWLLNKGPFLKLSCIREGYESVMTNCISPLQIHDMETLFSDNVNPWTINELEQNCILGSDLTKDVSVIKYLFEVLSSLSSEDQKHFLFFVTGSTIVPFGGLSSLNPKLTIKSKTFNGNSNDFLPNSLTCLNTLIIPMYTDSEVLRSKLLLAIRDGCKSFSFV